MTWLEAIRAAIRQYIIFNETANVASDIVTNGLSVEDQAIVDSYLAQVMDSSP